jgi:membrane associated rhomboid family serine protease
MMDIGFSDAPLAYSLLAINVLASIFAFSNKEFMETNIFHMGSVLRRKEYYRIITSSFLHGDPMHLLFNMVTLFFFGPALEYLMGTGNFAILYFGSQLGAEAVTIWFQRQNLDYRSLGASGSVSGVVVGFSLYAPFSLLYIFGLIPIPAILFAALFILYSIFAMGGRGRIAHEAHLGGAVFGGILFAILTPDLVNLF